MGDVVSNIAKGRVRTYVDNHIANTQGASGGAAIIACLFSGTEADDTLRGYDTLQAVEAGALSECVLSGYVRKVCANMSSTKSNGTDDWLGDLDDIVWSGIVSGLAITRIGLFYCPVRSASNPFNVTNGDNLWVPLGFADFATIPDTTDITATMFAGGILRAV